MSTTVYLIGHGRVDATAPPAKLPEHITMHWLAPMGDVTAGLSYAFLNGRLSQEYGQTAPGGSVEEHYLCGEHADVDIVNDQKIKQFFSRTSADPHGSTDPYVLYTRGKTNVSLSSIFGFLTMLSPTNDWHVYWTCCRGFIGVKNPYTTKYDKAAGIVVRQARKDPEATPVLSDKNHKTVKADFKSVVLVAKSDAQHLNVDSPTHAVAGILRL